MDGVLDSSPRVLVVDDDASMCALLEVQLAGQGYQVVTATSARVALGRLGLSDIDVVLTDVIMEDMSGLELCERIVEARPDVPVVVMTADTVLETAIAAIRVGAYDFVTKPVSVDALAIALERAVRHRRLREEVQRLRQVVDDLTGFGDLVGTCAPMRSVYDVLERGVLSDAPVLVTGEPGTGKELVARVLHRRSRRSAGPFVVVNCRTLPAGAVDSEVFGWAGQAFPEPRAIRAGLLQQANGGTLFLDEIAELPPVLQSQLLWALQQGSVHPRDSGRIPSDPRLVASSGRALEAAVEEGRFRRDLYLRLNVARVDLPPLRARGAADILLLAQRFIDLSSGPKRKRVPALSEVAAERLVAYPWPGNVGELRSCIERAVALTPRKRIRVEDLPEAIRSYSQRTGVVSGRRPRLGTLDEVERSHILRVLAAAGGQRAMAARILGLDRKTLFRKLGRYTLELDGRANA